MTTSNFPAPGNVNLPDESDIARLANAFFRAVPTRSPVPPSIPGSDAVAPSPLIPTVSAALPSPATPAVPSAPPAPSVPHRGAPDLSAVAVFWPSPAPPARAGAPAVPPAPEPPSSDQPSGAGRPPVSASDAARDGATPPRGNSPAPSFLENPFGFVPVVAPARGPAASGFFDAAALRRDFPILQKPVNGRRLVWLDNAATTQKPRAVIDRLSRFYEEENSNIHRAAHALAARATDAYESAREKVRRFLGAGSVREIVFVRGATEAINLVAQSWGRRHVGAEDEIVVTWLEHHANIVPWQQLCAEKGARLRAAPVDETGQVRLDEFEKLLTPRTRLVAFAQVSNALGTVAPVKEMAAIAHRHGARVLIDGAQAVSHLAVDVKDLDADFYVFSGHKVFGPTGVGVLYGKEDLLNATPPWQGGGNMIADVTFEKTLYQPAPARFEAGTGTIADAVGLGAAIDYLLDVGLENVCRHEHALLEYGTGLLRTVPGLRLIGTAKEKAGVLSFVLDGVRNEDVGKALDREGIAVRAGHHCAQPILRRFGLESTVRASLAFYNTREDLDALAGVLRRLAVKPPANRV